MTSIRVIPVSAVLSRVPYECLYLQKWVTPPLSLAAPQREPESWSMLSEMRTTKIGIMHMLLVRGRSDKWAFT